MEHLPHQMVQEMVLHQGRARQCYILRRRLRPREEDQLDGPTKIQWSGHRADGSDRLVTPGRTRGGQEFPRRRVMLCQRRVHAVYEYQGGQDSTRLRPDNLEKPEIQQRINELFHLGDSSFVRSDNRMHAYKLVQPAPKVIVVLPQCSKSITSLC